MKAKLNCLSLHNQGYASSLINEAEKATKSRGMDGLCVMTSKGSWIANKSVFQKNGFNEVDKRGRFELFSKKWNNEALDPKLLDWTIQQKKYKGWNLVYADQCPWHEKSVEAMLNVAMDFDVDLKITKMETAAQAKKAPSGFGVFNLLYDGKLLEDHYLSATRFRTILQKELQKSGHE